MEPQELPIVHIGQVLNLGTDLRAKLEEVALREGIDARALGRRIVRAGLDARERAEAFGERGHE